MSPEDLADSDVLFEGVTASTSALEPKVDVGRMGPEERAAYERMLTAQMDLFRAMTSSAEAKPAAKRGRPRKKPGA